MGRRSVGDAAGSPAAGEAFLALPVLSDPLPLGVFLEAAEICPQGRRRGFTLRSSVDCLIAAVAIENRVPVWRGASSQRIAELLRLGTELRMPVAAAARPPGQSPVEPTGFYDTITKPRP